MLIKDILNCTPVHLAAVQNQVGLILHLADALVKDVGGRTPLHEIARRGCMQDLMAFLHLGWDFATREDDGRGDGRSLRDSSPLWAAVDEVVDLTRPGMGTLQLALGWHPLHVAAMSGDIRLIERLVRDHVCDLHVKSTNSWAPLHYAAAYNHVAAIGYLCSLGCEVSVRDAVGSTPLHVAAGEGQDDAVRALVELGCSPRTTDRDGCTPLYCAAAWNRIETVRLLEELERSSSIRCAEGRVPLHVAAEQGWVELVHVLVEEFDNAVDVKDQYEFYPMHSAAMGGHVDVISSLIRLRHPLEVKDCHGRTPLHYAAINGRREALRELVKLGSCVEERDSRGGYTPLHLAADAGQCEIIQELVVLGADVDAPARGEGEESGKVVVTPLGVALAKGPSNLDAIVLLVELGANVKDITRQNLESPLHLAARSGRLDMVQRLLACDGVSVDVRIKDGSTPLHYAAAFGHTHVVEAICSAGCSVDVRDNALNTPLHLAAGCGFLDTVTKLVALGADVHARDCTDCTPIQNAAHGTYSALASLPGCSSKFAGYPDDAASTAFEPSCGALHSPSGYAKFNPPHQPQLTPAQQATQAAMTSSPTLSFKRDGLVPVRTGLAWSHPSSHPLETPVTTKSRGSMHNDIFSFAASQGLVDDVDACHASFRSGHGGKYSDNVEANGTGADWLTAWQSLGLTQLLKKAYKQQLKHVNDRENRMDRIPSFPASYPSYQLQMTQQSIQAIIQRSRVTLQEQLNKAQGCMCCEHRTRRAGELLDAVETNKNSLSRDDDRTMDKQTSFSGSPKALTELDVPSALRDAMKEVSTPCSPLSQSIDNLDVNGCGKDTLLPSESDRSRLIAVVEKLVNLGADVQAVDNEGRTALHLAAGCGDLGMAIRLVDLGLDVNSRDSVGGTAMHHAAMANKKEMMFALARMGCDWRAKADGIEGATASFVLCGQHGKTTRQQKLLDAKLKRVYQEGEQARACGRDPFVGKASEESKAKAVDYEAEQAMADAAMQALLEEEEARAEGEARKAAKKLGKKKKGNKDVENKQIVAAKEASKKPSKSQKGKEDGSVLDAPHTPANVLEKKKSGGNDSCDELTKGNDDNSNARENQVRRKSASTTQTSMVKDGDEISSGQDGSEYMKKVEIADERQPELLAAGLRTEEGKLNAPIKESTYMFKQDMGTGVPDAAIEMEGIRMELESTAEGASRLLASFRGLKDEHLLEEACQKLDAVIAQATSVGVSAKYGKKVRKKLQLTLYRLQQVHLPSNRNVDFDPLRVQQSPGNSVTAASTLFGGDAAQHLAITAHQPFSASSEGWCHGNEGYEGSTVEVLETHVLSPPSGPTEEESLEGTMLMEPFANDTRSHPGMGAVGAPHRYPAPHLNARTSGQENVYNGFEALKAGKFEENSPHGQMLSLGSITEGSFPRQRDADILYPGNHESETMSRGCERGNPAFNGVGLSHPDYAVAHAQNSNLYMHTSMPMANGMAFQGIDQTMDPTDFTSLSHPTASQREETSSGCLPTLSGERSISARKGPPPGFGQPHAPSMHPCMAGGMKPHPGMPRDTEYDLPSHDFCFSVSNPSIVTHLVHTSEGGDGLSARQGAVSSPARAEMPTRNMATPTITSDDMKDIPGSSSFDTLIGHDIASHMFVNSATGFGSVPRAETTLPPSSQGIDLFGQNHMDVPCCADLISTDLLGEIDGTHLSPGMVDKEHQKDLIDHSRTTFALALDDTSNAYRPLW